MAQLHFDGFDLGLLPDWSVIGSPVMSTATAFGQGLCLQLPAGLAPTPVVTRAMPASAELYVGFRYLAAASSPTQVLQLYGDGGATEHIRLWWSTNTTLVVGRGGTTLATAPVTEPVGTWVFVEVHATVADSGGRLTVKVDGAVVIDYTGDTKNAGTATTLDALRLTAASAGAASAYRLFDDFYINDATGPAPHNTFYGPCRVYALAPTGAGTQTQLTPSAGANWAAVDEQPYSATDYVSSSTVGQRDTYAMADLPAGVATVYGVRPTAIAKATDAAAINLKTVVRSGGTVYGDTAAALGASDGVVSAIRSVDPATGAAWTVAAVNAVEAGVEVA